MAGGAGEQRAKLRDFAPAPNRRRVRRMDPAVFYGRLVVTLVVAIVVLVAALAAVLSAAIEPSVPRGSIRALQLGPLEVLVNRVAAPREAIAASALVLLAVLAFAVAFEAIEVLATTGRRSRYLQRLRGRRSDAAQAGRRVKVTVLIPAHNEELALPATLASLAAQHRPPDRVVVVADNCSDRTVEIARSMGHEAFETVGNEHKKGGALNQALALLLPLLGEDEAVLVMDADTVLEPGFLSAAAERMERDPELAAVGGIFRGEEGHGLVGQLQRNEYARYGAQIRQRRGRVFVLTGTATLFRVGALLDVAAARGSVIPGEPGRVYDTAALTEDNELTIALKAIGAPMVSPQGCSVTTELMPTWGNLWRQRQRWQRGGLENIGAYGITFATMRYLGQQVGIGYGTFALNASFVLVAVTALSVDAWVWFPFWIAIGALFTLERVVTAWSTGWRGRLLAAAVLPELAYDLFLQAVFVHSVWSIMLAREARWGHVEHQVGHEAEQEVVA